MNPLLLDTHSAVWYLRDPTRLSSEALNRIRASLAEGLPLFISVISLIELVYLVEKGRVPREALEDLKVRLEDPSGAVQALPVDPSIIEAIQRIPRDAVPDMPDRIIAATALQSDLELVTRDRRIRKCGVATIW